MLGAALLPKIRAIDAAAAPRLLVVASATAANTAAAAFAAGVLLPLLGAGAEEPLSAPAGDLVARVVREGLPVEQHAAIIGMLCSLAGRRFPWTEAEVGVVHVLLEAGPVLRADEYANLLGALHAQACLQRPVPLQNGPSSLCGVFYLPGRKSGACSEHSVRKASGRIVGRVPRVCSHLDGCSPQPGECD